MPRAALMLTLADLSSQVSKLGRLYARDNFLLREETILSSRAHYGDLARLRKALQKLISGAETHCTSTVQQYRTHVVPPRH
jgi:hypothetical protein